MVVDVVTLIVGLALVLAGAKLLVDKAQAVAEGLRIPPLLISLTVVSLGTSLPELVVSYQAAIADPPSPGMALGNVVGSNIANILMVLGCCALIRPLIVSTQTIKLDGPYMIGVSLLVIPLVWGGTITGVDGGILIVAALFYTVLLLFELKKAKQGFGEKRRDGDPTRWQILWWSALGILGGTVMVMASEYVVLAAKSIAMNLGMSEELVGLTILAIGTSLPELISSGYAAWKGRADMAIGGLIGSNLCNICVVLGVTAVAAPNGVPVSQQAIHWDIPIMCGVAILGYVFAFTGRKIVRWEGAVFVVLYVAYLTWRVLTNGAGT